MILPSDIGGFTTTEVGFFHHGAYELAEWMVEGRNACPYQTHWEIVRPAWSALGEVLLALHPSPGFQRHAWVPVGGGEWTVLLNNGLRGTEVGARPRIAAERFGCRAIRAVSIVDGTFIYPARMLEVCEPDGRCRSIWAANDGGRWVFGTGGEAYPFEDLEAYTRRRKSHRFTPEMVYDYLRHLDVPIDTEPSWADAVVVEGLDRWIDS